MTAQSPKLEIVGVRKEFDDGKQQMVALDGIDLSCNENEFCCLVGTSGCGKSTLLSIVAGLQEPTAGHVLIDGQPIEGPGRDRGVVFQTYTLFPWLTARENVEFALRHTGADKKTRQQIAIENLDLVDLTRFADSYPSQLSGGMKQRVAIARSLSYHPAVLLMDEPFGALDALTRQMMQELLTAVWERHRMTVLFVTHDVDEAVFVADRVVVMTNRPGRIKQDVAVTLPRPRSFDMTKDEQFAGLKHRIVESLRAEALETVVA